jgi:hypothetical protein
MTIATVIAADNSIVRGIPIQDESGPAIARPSGLNKSDPTESNDEMRERTSRGTVRCTEVGQMLAHKSRTIHQKSAAIAITQIGCGPASVYI